MTAIYANGSSTRASRGTAIRDRARADRASVDRALVQPRLRMTARGRRVLAALVALPLVIAAAAFALNGGVATATSDPASLSYVSVHAGETLWQLAQQVAPQSDPRDVVADIISINHLDTETITPGQSLAIPPKYLP